MPAAPPFLLMAGRQQATKERGIDMPKKTAVKKEQNEQHVPRINLLVSAENYQFVSVMSRLKGQSMNTFVCSLLDECRKKNQDTFLKALTLMEEAGGADGK